MIDWMSRHLGTLVVALFLLAAVAGIVRGMVRDRRKGKCLGCDGGCGSCASRSGCDAK